MGRTLQDPAGDAGERDPHVAVPEMPVGQEKRHGEDVAVQKRERANAGAEGVGHDAKHNSGREPDPVHEHDDLDRVLAQLGQGGHHLGGMVDLVELPERRDLVKAIVGGPVGEFVGQELKHGRERQDHPGRPEEGRVRPEFAREPGDDGVTPEEQAEAQHAVGGGEHDCVQPPEAHVDQGRGMEENTPGEGRAEEPGHAEAPAARSAPASIVERGERQSAAERRPAIGRGGPEILLYCALQRRPESEWIGHGSPLGSRLTQKA